MEFLLLGTTVLQEESLPESAAGLLRDRTRDAEMEAGLETRLQTIVDLVSAGDIQIDRQALARRRNA